MIRGLFAAAAAVFCPCALGQGHPPAGAPGGNAEVAAPSAEEEAAFRAWFKKTWEQANKPGYELPIRGVMFEYETEHHYPALPGELEELAQRVEGKPDHPDRRRYEQMLKYRSEGAVINIHRHWRKDNYTWRYSVDYPGNSLPWYDRGSRSSAIWGLAYQHQLTVAQPGTEKAERHFSGNLSGTWVYIGCFLWQGLHTARGLMLPEPSFVELQGDGRWLARTERSDGLVMEYRGRWLNDEGIGIVESMRSSGPSELLPERAFMECADFRRDGVGLPFVAHEVRRLDARGLLVEVFRLKKVERYDDDYLDALTRLPEMKGTDPLRGELNIRQVHDYRPSTMLATVRQSDGSIEKRPMEPVGEPAGSGSVRSIGLVAAGAIGVIVVIAAIRKWRIGS